MKSIIDGKRYDTETATRVAQWDNGCGSSDFNAIDEELYITKKGNWFLDGEGGARTQYAVSCGNNSWSGNRKLIPMGIEEAKEWLEEHYCTEALEQYFGDSIEDA